MVKVKYFGDKNSIADATTELYKQEKYNPFANVIPLCVQIVILLGIVDVVKHPQYASIEEIDMCVKSIRCYVYPYMQGGWYLIMPILAGFSAFILGIAQNKMNPLQREQSQMGKVGTMGFSVLISLSLGAFVPVAVGIYWIFSNLFAVIQQACLNFVINPKKYINYEELQVSKEKLKELENIGESSFRLKKRPYSKKERLDYKKFFSIANKHLVIYSEGSGFYKYYKNIIEYLLVHSNLIIHYVTNDPHDQIFELEKSNSRIRGYYIGEKRLITLMMKMDADMVLMTVPDLNRFHIKRSYIREDIEYVYVFHYPLSSTISFHPEGLKAFDTVLCTGQFQVEEIRKREEVYRLPAKKLVVCGYGQLDNLKIQYENIPMVKRTRKKILLAPSWQADNILDSCIDKVLENLLGKGWDIYLRPHPEYIKRYKNRMNTIVERYKDVLTKDLFFELDFTSNTSLFDSDIVITDWSGAAYEFAYVTGKPVVFIDTTMKCNNPEYKKIGIEPLEVTLRSQVGIHLSPNQLEDLHQNIQYLLMHTDDYITNNFSIRDKYVANYGYSGEVAGKYIITSLKDKASKRSKSK
ncbi:membrane protein insertase YidC [Lachnospiraceae bacterium]|nr:membrane protein insertase YidC [Lachnospiraceae bacterium]